MLTQARPGSFMIRFLVRSTFVLAVVLTIGALPVAAAASTDPAARVALVEKIIATTEAAVADPRWVAGPEWAAFVRTLRDPELRALDDAEFRAAFNDATEALPFTHLRLHWQEGQGSASDEPSIALDWPRDDVARIRVRMFAGDPAEFAARMQEVIEAAPHALVLDLRGTPGGSFPTAVALSRALNREALDAGAFLTRGWYARYGRAPDAEQYAAIAPLETLDLDAFAAQLRRDGAARLVLPAHDDPIFEGRVVILTDSGTGSTSEPLVYRLQQQGVPVVGERTAGAMLSAEHFPMNETFRLFLPVADYVAPDLVRLDRRGVVPDIQVAADQALERALDLLDESA
jgi:carboxyl-terminal processing protease